MALKSWNEIDNKQIATKEYYGAFIDILGYKDKAEMFFNGKLNLEGRFNRALNNSISIINNYKLFVDASKVEIKNFSDSIIFLLPKSAETQDQLFSLVYFCAILSAQFSFEGLFVRGGISHGPHRESQNDRGVTFLASIALQKAYLLESKHAKNPRILVDEELVAQLVLNKDLILVKELDEYFVHFSPLVINNTGNNTSIVLLEMQEIAEKREQAPDDAKEKYTWILDYYYWTLSLIPDIDMNIFEAFAPQKHRGFDLLDTRK